MEKASIQVISTLMETRKLDIQISNTQSLLLEYLIYLCYTGGNLLIFVPKTKNKISQNTKHKTINKKNTKHKTQNKYDGRRLMMEDNLWWKTTYDGRLLMMEDNLLQKTTLAHTPHHIPLCGIFFGHHNLFASTNLRGLLIAL